MFPLGTSRASGTIDIALQLLARASAERVTVRVELSKTNIPKFDEHIMMSPLALSSMNSLTSASGSVPAASGVSIIPLCMSRLAALNTCIPPSPDAVHTWPLESGNIFLTDLLASREFTAELRSRRIT